MSTRLQKVLLIGAIIIAVGSLSFAGWAFWKSSHLQGQLHTEIERLNQQLKLAQGMVADQRNTFSRQLEERSHATEAVLPTALSTTTRELLERSPIRLEKDDQTHELSEGVFLVQSRTPGENNYTERIWFLDLNRMQFHHVTTTVIGEGRSEIEKTTGGGAVIRISVTPGEAVRDVHQIFIDSSGEIVAQASSGDYHLSGDEIHATIGTRSVKIELLQGGGCENRKVEYAAEDRYMPLIGAIRGLNVNGRDFLFRQPVAIGCVIGYGDSVGNPQLPVPDFDGQRITFYLPGRDVAISASGSVTYTPKVVYDIPCSTGYLTREDETGVHVVESNLLDHPALKKYFGGYRYCFEPASFNGTEAIFTVMDYENGHEGKEIETIVYDIEKKTFETVSD